MSIRDVIRRLVEARQMDDAADAPEEPEARLAIYDSPLTTPRVISLSGEDFETLIGELAAQTYNYSHERGGRIPFVVLLEVLECLIHTYFRDAVITILDDGVPKVGVNQILHDFPKHDEGDAPSALMGVVVRLCGQLADQGFEVFGAERENPWRRQRRVVNGEADLRFLRRDRRVIRLAFLYKPPNDVPDGHLVDRTECVILYCGENS